MRDTFIETLELAEFFFSYVTRSNVRGFYVLHCSILLVYRGLIRDHCQYSLRFLRF